jgi:NDP-sugar pyrophosphorylase family protein
MELQNVWCFIPVGGLGKRLMPLTSEVAKPCIRFLNRPLIEFSIIELAEQGIRNLIFGEHGYTNYVNLFDVYGEGVGVSAKYNIRPRLHIKHQPNLDDLGSAHSFWLNLEYYDINNPFLVVQGDNLFKFDLSNFVKQHLAQDALMSIALVEVENTAQYGVAELDDDLRIQRFVEKPLPAEAPSNLASSGIYLISPQIKKVFQSEDILRLISKNNRLDFGYDLIPYLVGNGYPVYGYPIQTWYDIGTPERYLAAMLDVLHGKIDIRVAETRALPDKNIWAQGFSRESIRRRNELIRKYHEKKLFLEGAALIGRHTRIDNDSKISDSNVDNFCILDDHVYVERSAIMDGCRIGSYTHIMDSIIGRKNVIQSSHENPTYIASNSVTGNQVQTKEGCKLIRTRVNPNLIIPKGMTYIDKYLRTYEDVVQLSS